MSDMLKLLKIIDKVEKPVAINESVSLNISVSGDGADDVINMMAKLMNPQGGAAHQAITKLPMAQTLDSVSGYADEAGHAYADEVGEDWENTPDPEVSDVEYMTKDLAGGLNKPKQMVKKEYPGDNPMTSEGSLANKLMAEYKNLIENDSKDKEGKVVHCSQCAKGFRLTPNTSKKYHTGFSHCKDHKGLKVAVSEASADTLNRYREKAVASDTSKMNPNKAFHRTQKGPALAGAKIAAGKDDPDSQYALNRYKMSGGKVNVPAKEDKLGELDRNRGGVLDRYIRKTDPSGGDPKAAKHKAGRDLALLKKHGDKKYGFPEPKVKAVERESINQIDELSTDTYHRAAHKAANRAMWDAEGTSGKKYKKYSAMANKFRAKGMEQEKREKDSSK